MYKRQADYRGKIYELAVEIAGIKGDVQSVTPPPNPEPDRPTPGQWL